MNNLADNLVNHLYDYSIGDKKFWQSKLKNVVNDMAYFNADDIDYEYFLNNQVKHKYLQIDIIKCWSYLDDNKFKQCIINNTLHILTTNNHQFYNEIEYDLLV